MLLNVLKTLRRLRQFLSGSFVFRIFAVTNLYLYGRGKAKKETEKERNRRREETELEGVHGNGGGHPELPHG